MTSVYLRSLELPDSDLLFAWINRRELVILSAPFHEVDRRAHDRWFDSVRASANTRIFAIALTSDDRTIGYCQLKNIDSVSRCAELQIRIGDSDMHGKGAGTSAVRQLLDFGFGSLGLHRVYLQVFATNIRARRTYAACGFSDEGVLRQAVCIEGKFQDIVVMGVLSGEQK